jgi:ferredoxin
MEANALKVDQTLGFGCIACGACEVYCPTDAIRISGRDLLPADLVNIAPASHRTGYDPLYNLLAARRSTRKFKQRAVEPEIVEKILESASTAPVGIPPSDVSVLVFRTPSTISGLRDDLINAMKNWPIIFSPALMTILRPFIGKENADMFGKFLAPAVNKFLERNAAGEDWLLYDPPLAIYFYGTAYNDPADPVVTATIAMLAGESFGLGTCLLGFPGYIFQNSAPLRRKYGLPKKIQPGLMVVFGYPAYTSRYALRRRFRDVRNFA